MTIRATIRTATPGKAAQAMRLVLALEKGYSSVLVPDGLTDLIMLASDGQAIRFAQA